MIDSDIAAFYGVQVKRLNEQVKRNQERFPVNFMFQLTKEEYNSLRSQFVTLGLKSQFAASSWGGKRKLPYVFTEHGVVMLSSVLKSKRAVQVSIAVVNAFIKMREYLATHKQFAEKLEKFEKKLLEHDKHLVVIYKHLNKMIEVPKEPRKEKKYGFR